MQPKTWYLGPLGDLRPLMSPDGGVSRPVQRFGGVHQALSGARTMDITGHRATYTLEFPWMSPADARFLEALHYRTVPGPFYLLDPMTTNRLSRSAAMLLPYSSDVVSSGGGLFRSPQAPADVGVPVTSLEWSSYSGSASIRLPAVPVLADETLTLSVWARSASTVALELAVDLVGLAGADSAREAVTVALGAEWDRYTLTVPVPADTASARVTFSPTGGALLWLAAAQLETGTTATAWDMGGGAPAVLVDQVDRSSPNYPRSDLSVTLLEV